MACKLIVHRFTNGKDHKGDVVGAYPFERYLGTQVEPMGGAFSIIELMDRDPQDSDIQALLEPYLDHPTYNQKKFIVTPVDENNAFLIDLLTTGRTRGNYVDLQPFIGEHI